MNILAYIIISVNLLINRVKICRKMSCENEGLESFQQQINLYMNMAQLYSIISSIISTKLRKELCYICGN